MNSLFEEPDAFIAHIRICAGPVRVTALGYPTDNSGVSEDNSRAPGVISAVQSEQLLTIRHTG